MSTKKRGGLGRGLAALIPTGANENPRLGNSAADVILGPDDRAESEDGDRSGKKSSPRNSVESRGHIDPIRGVAASGKKSRNKKTKDDSSDVSRETSDSLGSVGAIYRELPLDSIVPNPKQPRQHFDEEALNELVHSIHEFGLMQPIVVREREPGRYEIIMGERRWRASQLAHVDAIPAIIRETADDAMLRDALLENIHRVQLNPLEEAAAYQQLLSEFGVTHEQLADKLGRSRPVISNMIRLLQLPVLVQRRVAAGVLSAGHARAILGLTGGADVQEALARRIVAEGLSVRATEEIVTLLNRGGVSSRRVSHNRAEQPPELAMMATSLSDSLETHVTVTMGKRKGKIVIEFGSEDDLKRIAGVVLDHRKP